MQNAQCTEGYTNARSCSLSLATGTGKPWRSLFHLLKDCTDSGPAMTSIFEHSVEVRAADIDVLGHVNNVVYVQWMQNAAYAHSAALGWTLERYMELGAGWVARLHQIEYLQPAFEGDRVLVMTWVADMKKVTSTRRYRMVRFDPPLADAQGLIDPAGPERQTVLAVAHTTWAFIDYKRGTPMRIPAEMAKDFPTLA